MMSLFSININAFHKLFPSPGFCAIFPYLILVLDFASLCQCFSLMHKRLDPCCFTWIFLSAVTLTNYLRNPLRTWKKKNLNFLYTWSPSLKNQILRSIPAFSFLDLQPKKWETIQASLYLYKYGKEAPH